ncbi:MAG: hypothetical protein AAFV53_06150 [Myxococcota bacterium]
MRFLEVDRVRDASSDALEAMYRGDGDGLIIHHAFDPDEMAQMVAHLESSGGGYHWDLQEVADPQVVQMRVLGRTLTPVAGDRFDLDEYATIGEATRTIITGQWPGFFGQLERLTQQLSGGRPVRRVQANGRAYGPATIRHLPVGCQIPVHCGLFFMETAGYRELMGALDDTSQLSWFVPMQTPEEGGELVIYDLAWGDADVPRIGSMYNPMEIERWPSVRIRPPVGSLLLFDGGRWFHKVSPIGGGRDRWTVGGFLGFTRAMDRLVYWS